MPLTKNGKILLLATAAGGLYWFLTRVNPYPPYDPNMKMDSYVFHNDPAANKRWWDNQFMRLDHKRESPPETPHYPIVPMS